MPTAFASAATVVGDQIRSWSENVGTTKLPFKQSTIAILYSNTELHLLLLSNPFWKTQVLIGRSPVVFLGRNCNS